LTWGRKKETDRQRERERERERERREDTQRGRGRGRMSGAVAFAECAPCFFEHLQAKHVRAVDSRPVIIMRLPCDGYSIFTYFVDSIKISRLNIRCGKIASIVPMASTVSISITFA
jgi:hypothetical protein